MFCIGLALASFGRPVTAQESTTTAIADIKRETPVDFEMEILPLLKRSCLACHNATVAESKLVLETPQTILKGGDAGPAAIAKNPAESLLLVRAAGGGDGEMPPKDNKVAAPPLTSEELGLLKLWIDQGAVGTVSGLAKIDWQPLPPGVNPIYAVAVSPDGQYAACGRANQVFVYHLPSGRFICRLTDPELLKTGIYQKPGVADLDIVQSLTFSPDGELLATGGYRSVKLWRRPHDTRTLTIEAATTESPQALAVSADGKWLAVAAPDHAIKLWDLSTGQAGATLAGHKGPVTVLRFAAGAAQIVSGSMDHSIRFWRLADGVEVGRIDTPAPVQALTVVGDGSLVASGGGDNAIRLWKAPTVPTRVLPALPTNTTAVAATTDRRWLALGGGDGQIRVVELTTGNVVKTLAGHKAAIISLAFQVNSNRLVSSAADNSLRLWDAEAAQQIAVIEGLAMNADAVAVHPGGAQAAAGSANGAVTLYKVENAALVQERAVAGHTARITGLAYNADGSLLYTGSADASVRAFQTADGAQRFAAAHGAAVNALAISPDGRFLASGGDDMLVKLWNAADGAAAPALPAGGFASPVRTVAFSRDNQRLIAGGTNANEIRVYALATNTLEQGFSEHAGTVHGLISAGDNGELVVSSGADNAIRVWPLAGIRQLAGHTQPVASLDTVPTAPTQIVSGSQDGTLKLWNTADGAMLRDHAHGGPVSAVAVRADGTRFVSAGANNVARLWNAADGAQVAEIKGDARLQVRAATLERLTAFNKNQVQVETAAVAASETAVTTEQGNVVKATEAATTAGTALTEKTTVATTTKTEKAAADQAAADAAAAAKTADEAKVAADKAVADADAAYKVAVDAKAAADKAVADATAKLTETQTILTKAQETKVASDKAAAEMAEKSKVATEAAAAKTKAADEAEAARKQAESAKVASDKAVEASNILLTRATEAVPVAKALLQSVDARAKQNETDLAAAKTAAAAAELPIRAVAFSADGQRLATAGDDRIVHLWSGDNGAAFETYQGQNGAVAAIGFVGDKLVSLSVDKSAVVWNSIPEWSWVRTIGSADMPALVDRVTSLDFSPDGKLLVTGSGDPSRSGELKIWNVETGELVREFVDAHSDTVLGVRFSPDGNLIASCGADKFVKVFDVASGKFVKSFEGHTHHVLGVAWRADGKVLASCGADNVIKVWDFVTGEQRTTIGGFGKEITGIAFVGETPTVLTSSGDATVRLHNVDNGQNVRNFGGAADFVYAIAATADGKLHLAGGQDGVLRVWNAENAQEVRKFEAPKEGETKP